MESRKSQEKARLQGKTSGADIADASADDIPRKTASRRVVIVESDLESNPSSSSSKRSRSAPAASDGGSSRPARKKRAPNSGQYEWIDPDDFGEDDLREAFADGLSEASVSESEPADDWADEEYEDEEAAAPDAASAASRAARVAKPAADGDEDYETEAEDEEDVEVESDVEADEDADAAADYRRRPSAAQPKKTGRFGPRGPYKKKKAKKKQAEKKEKEPAPRKDSRPRQAKSNSFRRQINLSDYEDDFESPDDDSSGSQARRGRGRPKGSTKAASGGGGAPKARASSRAAEPEPDKIELILGHVIVNGTVKVLLKLKDRSYRQAIWLTQADYERNYSGQLSRLKKHLQYHDIPFVPQLGRRLDVATGVDAMATVGDPAASSGSAAGAAPLAAAAASGLPRGLDADPPGVANPAGVFFPADYVVIERVIDSNNDRHYLVKWKGLDYDQCTWEHDALLPTEADQDRIAEYHQMVEERLRRRNGRMRREPADCQKPRVAVPSFRRPELQLRDFQVEGFQWLAYCWHQRRSCMLADEMGLGKTVQCLSLLQHMRAAHEIRGPFVVIVPLVTVGHWLNETRRWTDMAATVFHGSKEQRDIIREHDWFVRDNKGALVKGVYKWELVITTYEMVLQETSLLAAVEWECLILDEGHRIKNQKTKLLQKLVDITAEHKVLLTGTPLQNNTRELWALMNYLDPKEFASEADFMSKFGELKEAEQVSELHQVLAPYLLRRLKQDVEKSIPMKEETIVEIELTAIQKAYYRAILDRNREFLARGATRKGNLPRLVNVMMEIRKVCNHPFLTKGAEDYIVASNTTDGTDARTTSNDMLVRSSAKLILVDKLLPKLQQGNHKVLIFTQMRMMLDLLEEYMQLRGYKYERLDGGVKGSDRQERIDRFCAPGSDRFVFMCTTRAGGLGINLTVADTVIIFDSDWNPQNDLQAQARAHRIGQTANVQVYRLVTRNTYERHMLDVASRKLALDHVVLNTNLGAAAKDDDQPAEGDDDDGGDLQKEFSHKQIDTLLKYGAYNLFADDPNAENEKERMMMDEDIDTILQRSSTIKYMDAGGKDELSGFSKATFYTDDAESTVDLEDADFWQKIMPKVERSADYFRAKFQDRSALIDAHSKSHFLDELSSYAKQVKQTAHVLDATEPGLSPAESALVKLLNELEAAPAHFNQRQRDTLRDLRMLIERPRLRRRPGAEIREWLAVDAAVEGFAGEEHDDDEDDDDDRTPTDRAPRREQDSDYSGDEQRPAAVHSENESTSDLDPEAEAQDPEGKKKRRRRRTKGEKEKESKEPKIDRRRAPPGTWSKMKRKDLMRSIHALGFNRWGKLRKDSGLPAKSKEEIQAFCECYVQACFSDANTGLQEDSFYITALRDTVRNCRESMIQVALAVAKRAAQAKAEAKSGTDETSAKEPDAKKRRTEPPPPGPEVMDVDALPAKSETASAAANASNSPASGRTSIEVHLRHMPQFYAPGEVISTQLIRQPGNGANPFEDEEGGGQLFVAVFAHTADCDDRADAAANAVNVDVDQHTNLFTLPRRGIVRVFPFPTEDSKFSAVYAPGFLGSYSIRVVWVSATSRQARGCGPATRFKVSSAETVLGAENLANPKRGTDQRVRQLFIMRDVRKIIHKYGRALERLADWNFENAKFPADWWQPAKHDRQLLLGTYKYGYGRWAEMRSDPAFTFNTDIPADFAFPMPHSVAQRLHLVLGTVIQRDPALRSAGHPVYSAEDYYVEPWPLRLRPATREASRPARDPNAPPPEEEYVLDGSGNVSAIPKRRRTKRSDDAAASVWPGASGGPAHSEFRPRGAFDPTTGQYVVRPVLDEVQHRLQRRVVADATAASGAPVPENADVWVHVYWSRDEVKPVAIRRREAMTDFYNSTRAAFLQRGASPEGALVLQYKNVQLDPHRPPSTYFDVQEDAVVAKWRLPKFHVLVRPDHTLQAKAAEHRYQVKGSTEMIMLMKDYLTRHLGNQDASDVHFYYRYREITVHDTPDLLGLEPGDEIRVSYEQSPLIRVTLSFPGSHSEQISVSRGVPLQTSLRQFGARLFPDELYLYKFWLSGKNIDSQLSSPPESLNLRDGSVLRVARKLRLQVLNLSTGQKKSYYIGPTDRLQFLFQQYCQREGLPAGKTEFRKGTSALTVPLDASATAEAAGLVDGDVVSAGPPSEFIKAKCVTHTDEVETLHLLRTDRFKNFMETYCRKYQVDVLNVQFMFRNAPLLPDQCADDVGMGDGHIIRARLLGKLHLRMRTHQGVDTKVLVNQTDSMQTFLEKYAMTVGLQDPYLKVAVNGMPVRPNDTPELLGLTATDVLQVIPTESMFRLQLPTGELQDVRYPRYENLQRLFSQLSQELQWPPSVLVLKINGRQLIRTDTPDVFGIEDPTIVVSRLDVASRSSPVPVAARTSPAVPAPPATATASAASPIKASAKAARQKSAPAATARSAAPATTASKDPRKISLRVEGGGKGTDNKLVTFKALRDQPLQVMFDRFAAVRGLRPGEFILLHNGNVVKPTDTPEQAGLDDQALLTLAESFSIQVQGFDTKLNFKVKLTTPLYKLMMVFANQNNLDGKRVRFDFDGRALSSDDTPGSVGMSPGSIVTAWPI